MAIFQSLQPHVKTLQVTWLRGDALHPSSFSPVLDQVDGVVHTLGTLLEGAAYKQPLKDGNPLALLSSLVSRFSPNNPLKQGTEGSYELVNRDSGTVFSSICHFITQQIF